MKLTDADRDAMDRYINAVLERYKTGKIDRAQAQADLARALSAAALGNEGEFRRYINTDPSERWKWES
jgi:hypothetical protein